MIGFSSVNVVLGSRGTVLEGEESSSVNLAQDLELTPIGLRCKLICITECRSKIKSAI